MPGLAPATAPEYWDKYRPNRPRPAADRFDWTGRPGHGPGAGILGDPETALDLGPAEGENAAFLARRGVAVTAVDFSPVQVARARMFWADVGGLEFVLAEACAFLDGTVQQWDAIYSTWGAAWFTDPEHLFPLVLERLTPGGVFAFSHREPAVDEYGAQQMGGAWLEGRKSELVVYRWQYTTQQWAGILKRHGFTDVRADVLPNPTPGDPGTLLVQARTA